MRVDVYICDDSCDGSQFLLVPEGQVALPQAPCEPGWRKLTVASTKEEVLDRPLTFAESDLKYKGFAILRANSRTKDWSEASDEEITLLEEPGAWQEEAWQVR